MEYKRLTERNSVGLVDTLCKHCMFSGDCTRSRTHCDRAVRERLYELEDKIESGKLVRLPCAIEDKVYRVTKTYLSPFNSKKYEWVIEESYILRCEMNSVDIMFYDNWGNLIEPNDWGRGVFLTKEDAEKKLEEIKNER